MATSTSPPSKTTPSSSSTRRITSSRRSPIPTAAGIGPQFITTGTEMAPSIFTTSNANVIEQLNSTTRVFKTFFHPHGQQRGQRDHLGARQQLMVHRDAANKIGQLNPATGVITELPVPNLIGGISTITTGPDGNLDFTEPGSNSIGQFDPITDHFQFRTIPVANSGAADITAGPDGNLYFTETTANEIGEANPATLPSTEAAIPTASSERHGHHGRSRRQRLLHRDRRQQDRRGCDHHGDRDDDNANRRAESFDPRHFRHIHRDGRGRVRDAHRHGHLLNRWRGPSPVKLTQFNGQAQASFSTSSWGLGAQFIQSSRPTAAGPGFYRRAPRLPSRKPSSTLFLDGPIVLKLQCFGVHDHPTTLVLTFDKPLDPASAQNLRNYRLVNPHGRRA